MPKKIIKDNASAVVPTEPEVTSEVEVTTTDTPEVTTTTVETTETKPEVTLASVVVPEEETKAEAQITTTQNQKYATGSIVFIKNDATADLNGFKLFPQYKKYTYTVEDYDPATDVYTLRRLNLKLQLESKYLVVPSERAHDSINRKRY